jgi:hypothetical protein
MRANAVLKRIEVYDLGEVEAECLEDMTLMTQQKSALEMPKIEHELELTLRDGTKRTVRF